jgi:hypothetical protein
LNIKFVELFKSLKESQQEFVFRNAFPDTPSFEDFINFREKSNKIEPTRWEYDFKLSLNFELEGSPFLSQNKNFYNFRENLYQVWGDELWDEPAIIITEEMGDGSGLGKHFDPCPQIHWNCIGKTVWVVERFDGTEMKYVLNPGDIIYLAEGMKHAVSTITSPRAGIAYSIDQKDFRKDPKRQRPKYDDL